MAKISESVITDALQRLSAQWRIEQNQMHGKREALKLLLHEVGETRFNVAISKALTDHKSDFCPTIAQIRTYVPDATPAPWNAYCVQCQGNGWIAADKDLLGNDTVKRCPCWYERKASREAGELMPRSEFKPTAEDYAYRKEYPEEFWGEADLWVLMAAQAERWATGKATIHDPEEAQHIILAARKQAQAIPQQSPIEVSSKTDQRRKKVREGKDFSSLLEIMRQLRGQA